MFFKEVTLKTLIFFFYLLMAVTWRNSKDMVYQDLQDIC